MGALRKGVKFRLVHKTNTSKWHIPLQPYSESLAIMLLFKFSKGFKATVWDSLSDMGQKLQKEFNSILAISSEHVPTLVNNSSWGKHIPFPLTLSLSSCSSNPSSHFCVLLYQVLRPWPSPLWLLAELVICNLTNEVWSCRPRREQEVQPCVMHCCRVLLF